LAQLLPAAECADEDLPLIEDAYRERVKAIIADQEQRAARGELYARLALVIWRREWGRIERGELY